MTSGYLNLGVKTTKIIGITREVNFSNGVGKVAAADLIGFIPKWGVGYSCSFSDGGRDNHSRSSF